MIRPGTLFFIMQLVAALRVFSRMARTAQGTRIERATESFTSGEAVTVLVPVLNEATRLGPCLEGLVAQGREVTSILVIDGGSTDGTQELVRKWEQHDDRVRLVDAHPLPDSVNGKAYGLQVGLDRAEDTGWILTIDADVRPQPGLVPALLAHAEEHRVDALSVATSQQLSGAAEAVVHPSMLATLVYRFGIPGHATTDIHQIQANGQCFLVQRSVLDEAGGFAAVLNANAEDVTLARRIAARGHPVGFYESDDLVHVEMYTGWRDAWDHWSRSLPMRERSTDRSSAVRLVEATLTQALPIWLLPVLVRSRGSRHPATMLNTGLVIARFGVLAGMARAYRTLPGTYWFSPFVDFIVMARIWQMWSRRIHMWRGRRLVSGDTP